MRWNGDRLARQWAKREMQLVSVLDSTSGMVGDLQAIVGQAMPSIANIDTPLIESASDGSAADLV